MENLIEIYSFGLAGNKDKVAIEYPTDMGRYTIEGMIKHLNNGGYDTEINEHGMLVMSIPNSVFVKGALSNNMSREMEKVLENIKAYINKRDSRFNVEITSSDYKPETEESENEENED